MAGGPDYGCGSYEAAEYEAQDILPQGERGWIRQNRMG